MIGRRGASRALLAGLVTVLFVVASGSAVSSRATPKATSDSISVLATNDYGYQPDTIENVPTGATVTVTFTDASDLAHSFTITSREGFVIPTSYDPTQLNQFLSEYPPLFSIYVNNSGDQYTKSFQSPTDPGWYEFVCNVSGHFQLGMYGFIAFGENLPTNISPPPRTPLGGVNLGLGEEIAIGALVGGLLVAFVVWRYYRTPPPPQSR